MSEQHDSVRIWDIWVRLFHWSLVVCVTFLLISGETGWLFFNWHRLAGEVVLALILFRLLWALWGSDNARVGSLIHGPASVLQHLKQLWQKRLPPERGHNAAGAWAVILLILLLTVQAITGMLIADEDEFMEGALYGSVSDSLTDLAYRIHHMNAGLLQALVLFHVAMVFVYLLYARRDLIRPMLSGRMPWKSSEPVPEVRFQRFAIGLLCSLLAIAVAAWLAGWVA